MNALPEADRKVFSQPVIAAGFIQMIVETSRNGPRGATEDTELMVSPWGFDLSEVRRHVDLWQGEDDRNAPPAMGRYLASALPDCRARFLSGEGHISLPVHRFGDVLHELATRQSTSAP